VLAQIDYLSRLNPEQRRAVEHGVGTEQVGGPLLVIAGAGSGKTNTLAHRVAHLIVSGADPRRILLMTFSRRAAGEMARRVERIAGQVMGTSSHARARERSASDRTRSICYPRAATSRRGWRVSRTGGRCVSRLTLLAHFRGPNGLRERLMPTLSR